jgi:YHS domain-containing protein
MSGSNGIPGTRERTRPTVYLRSALLLPGWMLAATGLVSLGYRIGQPRPAAVSAEVTMPSPAPAGKQAKLYLTPAGLYTSGDVRANGGVTAADRYRGQMAQHDPRPAMGDRVCPITDTKANPRFTWVVGGRTYLFCCPACIDEFVSRAKTNPDSIRPPEQYVKR